jgi:hypothetical protein
MCTVSHHDTFQIACVGVTVPGSASVIVVLHNPGSVLSVPTYITLLQAGASQPSYYSFFLNLGSLQSCLTYTSRRGSQHRGQTAEHEDTKARKAKLQRPRTAAQGSLSHKQQAKQANKGPDSYYSCAVQRVPPTNSCAGGFHKRPLHVVHCYAAPGNCTAIPEERF